MLRRVGAGGRWGREEEVADGEGADDEDEDELRDIDRLFGGCGRHGWDLCVLSKEERVAMKIIRGQCFGYEEDKVR